jgi:hypothetical protein
MHLIVDGVAAGTVPAALMAVRLVSADRMVKGIDLCAGILTVVKANLGSR